MASLNARPIASATALVAVAATFALATVAACTPSPALSLTPEPPETLTVAVTATPTNSPTPRPSATPTPHLIETVSSAWESPTPGPSPTPIPDSDVDAGKMLRLTRTYDSERNPAYSPSGDKIVFECYDDGWLWNQPRSMHHIPGNIEKVRNWPISSYDFISNICVMNADGSGRAQLTDAQGDDVDPAWSPDGNGIIFSSCREGGCDIYVMNADGSRTQAGHRLRIPRGTSNLVARREQDRVRDLARWEFRHLRHQCRRFKPHANHFKSWGNPSFLSRTCVVS